MIYLWGIINHAYNCISYENMQIGVENIVYWASIKIEVLKALPPPKPPPIADDNAQCQNGNITENKGTQEAT